MESSSNSSRNRTALLFATLSGLAYLIPHLLFSIRYGFNGYIKLTTGDEIEYGALLARFPGNPYTWELRRAIVPLGEIPRLVNYLPARIIGIENYFFLFDFLGPFLICLLAFHLLRRLLDGDIAAERSLAAACCMFTVFLCLPDVLWWNFIDKPSPEALKTLGSFSLYSIHLDHNAARFFNPAFSKPYLFIGLILFVASLQKPKRGFVALVAAGMWLGACVYSNIYDAPVAFAAIALIFLWSLMRGDREKLVRLLIVGVAAVVVTLPKLFILLKFRAQGNLLPEHLVNGHYLSHRGFLMLAVDAAAAAFVFRFGDRAYRKPILFACALVAAGTAGDNMQLILGFNLEPWHFLGDYLLPYSLLVGLLAIASVVPPRAIAPLAGVGLVAASLWFGKYAVMFAPTYPKDPAQFDAYRQIVRRTPPDAVVATNFYPSMLAVYTRRYGFIPYNPQAALPAPEFCERFLITQKLLGYDVDAVVRATGLRNGMGYVKYYEKELYNFPSDTNFKYKARQLTHVEVDRPAFQKDLRDAADRLRTASLADTVRYARKKYRIDYLLVSKTDYHPAAVRELFRSGAARQIYRKGDTLLLKLL